MDPTGSTHSLSHTHTYTATKTVLYQSRLLLRSELASAHAQRPFGLADLMLRP